jgi:hypothetical protein
LKYLPNSAARDVCLQLREGGEGENLGAAVLLLSLPEDIFYNSLAK